MLKEHPDNHTTNALLVAGTVDLLRQPTYIHILKLINFKFELNFVFLNYRKRSIIKTIVFVSFEEIRVTICVL